MKKNFMALCLIAILSCTMLPACDTTPLTPAKYQVGDVVQTVLGRMPGQILYDCGCNPRVYKVRILTPGSFEEKNFYEYELETPQ